MKRLTLIGLVFVVLMLAACDMLAGAPTPAESTAEPVQTEPAGQPTEAQPTEAPPTATQPAEQPTETSAPEETPTEEAPTGVEACPVPGEGQEQYVSQEGGYCFLYPSGFDVHTNFSPYEHEVSLAGPPLDPDAMESIAASLQVDMTGPAVYVSSADEYAQMWIDLYGMHMEVAGDETVEVEVNGHPGVQVVHIPGMISSRKTFLVVDGVKYTISVQPAEETGTEIDEQVDELWNTVSGTIMFFQPEADLTFTRSEDVCPEPTDDMSLLISRADGFCYLYPAEFEETEDFAGGITAGPTVDVPNFGPMRARLVVAWAGPANDQTPSEIIESWAETGLDMSTVEETTIGGAPAVTYLDTRGPVDQPGAHVVANGWVYTMVANPYEPEEFPEVAAIVDEMWESVTGSLTFFDIWR